MSAYRIALLTVAALFLSLSPRASAQGILNFAVYQYTDPGNRSGMFYKAKGNTWINNASDGRIFYFTQTPESNIEFIQLHDFNRNFTCRLFANGVNYFWNNQYGWVRGAPGYWVE